ncbi:MAG: VWA domain-containing protein [bacterium]|nr:VWA domain-containing protein [bacterium]
MDISVPQYYKKIKAGKKSGKSAARRVRPSRLVVWALVFLLLPVIVSKNSYSQPRMLTESESRDLAQFNIAKRSFKKGIRYFNNMQYLAAVEFFRKAVQQYPDYYTARDYLARSYKLAGFSGAALRELENLAHLSPRNVSVASKIETIRFRSSPAEKEAQLTGMVLSGIYRASRLKRFGFTKPADIAIDNERNLYITSFDSGKLVKIDPNGQGLAVITPGLAGEVYGVDYQNNKLIVTGFKDDQVSIIDREGNIQLQFGKPGSGEGEFHGPEGACFDNRGYIYIVDSGNNRVQKFDDEGKYVLQFGETGDYDGQLKNPSDIAWYKNRLYVTDSNNGRIVSFDESGNFIRNLLSKELELPRGISRSGSKLLISDEKKGLLFYDLKRNSKKWFNSWKGEYKKFSRLMASATDRDGYLYCLDYNYESLFIFSPARNLYSNLEIEITSVDTEKFPVVAFYASVRTRDGKPVYGLGSSNFKITDDNAKVSSVYTGYLKKKKPSVSMVFCVDRSKSNSGYHNELPWVADFVLKKMRKNDAVRVMNFNSKTWQGNEFDWSRRRTIKALRKREYGRGKITGKALYNAVSDLLMKFNRRAVVLITDGSVEDDSFARYTARNVIEYAREHYVPIYIISLKKADPILKEIAEETGGALYGPRDLDGLRGIYKRIKGAEEYRYVLVYSTFKPASFKGWWSNVKLEVDYKGQKGVEWGGYFVP